MSVKCFGSFSSCFVLCSKRALPLSVAAFDNLITKECMKSDICNNVYSNGMRCCSGDLCNGAKQTGVFVPLLLAPLAMIALYI